MDSNTLLGEKLKTLRKAKKFSLKELSELTEISISFLSDIENNRSNPSIEKLKIICNALDIDPSFFLSSNSNPPIENTELLELLSDYPTWKEEDKAELLYYLKAKNIIRKSTK